MDHNHQLNSNYQGLYYEYFAKWYHWDIRRDLDT